ncbi:hypothetical protein ACWGKS_22365 [Nocardiopsis sp. NPDC055879]
MASHRPKGTAPKDKAPAKAPRKRGIAQKAAAMRRAQAHRERRRRVLLMSAMAMVAIVLVRAAGWGLTKLFSEQTPQAALPEAATSDGTSELTEHRQIALVYGPADDDVEIPAEFDFAPGD